jgi:thiamine biosynthesis protein ThiI
MVTFLIKPGELVLKKGNERVFAQALMRNLTTLLEAAGLDKVALRKTPGRVFAECPDDKAEAAEDAFAHLAGITGWARVTVTEKTENAVADACVAVAREAASSAKEAASAASTFKIVARRADKSFPLNSMQLAAFCGDAVLAAVPALRVDVHKPAMVITVEIRDKAYIYGAQKRGLRGLPVGTAGRGLLLLSGGIDSPVAGFLMALRGMTLDAVYFHSYPFTSNEAADKAVSLAKTLSRYTLGLRLFQVNLKTAQDSVKAAAPEPWRTVMLRMLMFEAAEKIAGREHCRCLITGESLSQVASQTIENITCAQSRVRLPVLRPLIGLDKEEIIDRARKLGTYETSIQPFPDCCSLFSPTHPVIYGHVDEANEIYERCAASSLIDGALSSMTCVQCGG